ncbi:MAG: cellulase [Myxococcales bacterium]|nr:cellulase [Myxococcales bacterium]MCB9736512.1 cellulase [Deltaproteobacteria bacterium]
MTGVSALLLGISVPVALACAPPPVSASDGAPGSCDRERPWPLWEAYTKRFVTADGRVIDFAADEHTTSEGEAYGAFFALVANDRARFDAIVRWTSDNLAQGDLAQRLPAWRWGKKQDEKKKKATWGVLDENAASDADLWLAYALLEAGRLWEEPRFDALGRAILAQVVKAEVSELPGLGPTLLPGPVGFALEGDDGATTWRLNPSYTPLPLLRRFASAGVPGPWDAVADSARRVAAHVREADGPFPDWIGWRDGDGFVPDPVNGDVGSYDAIRVYLWAALLPPGEPLRPLFLAATTPMIGIVRNLDAVPERAHTHGSEHADSPGPIGFSAAVAPAALATGDFELARRLLGRLAAARAGDGLYGSPAFYYEQNLILFATGHLEGRYRFATDGALEPEWRRPCP